MKLSMARVSVSSCRPHTSSSMDLRGTGLPSRWMRKRSRLASISVRRNTCSRTRNSSRSKWTDLSPKTKVSPGSAGGGGGGGRGGNRRSQPLAAAQESANARDQDGQFEGLRQVVVGARFETQEDVLGMTARGQHQGRNKLPRPPQFAHHGEPILAGQHDVQHHHVEARSVGQQLFERRLPGLHHFHLIALGLQIKTQALGQVQFVFHYEDSAHLAIGSWSAKVLPCPGPSLSAQTRPPCRLATERTMYSPRPVPLMRDASGPGTR